MVERLGRGHDGDRHRRLTLPVHLDHDGPEHTDCGAQVFLVKRRPADDDAAQAREGPAARLVDHAPQHRRGEEGGVRDLVLLDQPDEVAAEKLIPGAMTWVAPRAVDGSRYSPLPWVRGAACR